ncbi:MAG: hypothetical protein WEB58_14340 [Planctomycetaceae bacterium]
MTTAWGSDITQLGLNKAFSLAKRFSPSFLRRYCDFKMTHSYEELRDAALDVLAGREKTNYPPSQYEHLISGVAEVFIRRGDAQEPTGGRTFSDPKLPPPEREIFLEVFWDLFRQGIITLGLNDSNREFPWFHVSSFGRRILEGHDSYFFHDVSTYKKLINDQIPNLDQTTLLYLQEAMQAFKAGCLLSSSVMLGVATEHTFLLLMEAINNNPVHLSTFATVNSERTILRKVNKFKNILDQQLSALTREIKEDLDTNFMGILSMIRNFRNESGHPSGKIIDREQGYVLLQLFIPYCKKMYQLMDHYK